VNSEIPAIFRCSLFTFHFKMRLDLFLKSARLVLRRTLANELCDAGLVKINGASAKPSREVKAGDEIQIKRHNKITRVRVLQVPDKKQISKQEAPNLYEILSEEILEDSPFELVVETGESKNSPIK
jgi:ribosomal 50S subunit-recycling heat shock protein